MQVLSQQAIVYREDSAKTPRYSNPPRRFVKGRWRVKARWYSKSKGRYEPRMAKSGNRRKLLDGKWHLTLLPYQMRMLHRVGEQWRAGQNWRVHWYDPLKWPAERKVPCFNCENPTLPAKGLAGWSQPLCNRCDAFTARV